jgi:hypothetical protein
MRSKSRLVLTALLCLFFASSLVLAGTPVPKGAAPVLDGTLSEGDWDVAFSVQLNSQARLLLKHSDGFLFLGIQATTMGVGSPCIVRGEDILVLHASAALGTAIYHHDDSAWTLQQDFVWQCRTLGFSAYALDERARFLQENGWLGTIGYLGAPTQFEYQIAWGDQPLTFLFLFAEFTDKMWLLSWPISPADAAQYLTLITGPMPAEIHARLDVWATLERDGGQ